jgi:hypothetical protein
MRACNSDNGAQALNFGRILHLRAPRLDLLGKLHSRSSGLWSQYRRPTPAHPLVSTLVRSLCPRGYPTDPSRSSSPGRTAWGTRECCTRHGAGARAAANGKRCCAAPSGPTPPALSRRHELGAPRAASGPLPLRANRAGGRSAWNSFASAGRTSGSCFSCRGQPALRAPRGGRGTE